MSGKVSWNRNAKPSAKGGNVLLRQIKVIKKRLIIVGDFFKVMRIRWYHIAVPAILALVTAGFSGISIGLLAPMAKGVVADDFSFIAKIPLLRLLLEVVPGEGFFGLSKSSAIFLCFSGLIFLTAILRHLVNYLSSLLVVYWNGLFSKRINCFVFNRVLEFDQVYFDSRNQGEIQTVIGYAKNALTLLNLFQQMLRQLFEVIVRFIVMATISLPLTLITLIVFPVFHFLLYGIIRRLRELSSSRVKTEMSLSKKVFNILSCVPLIKVYSKEAEVKKDYENYSERLRELQVSDAKINNLISPIHDVIVMTALLVMVVVAVYLNKTRAGSDLSLFLVFFYVAQTALSRFSLFNNFRSRLAHIKPALKQVYKVIQADPISPVSNNGKEFPGFKKSIEIRNLSFSYPGRPGVLKAMNAQIEKGKVTAIVGPSGAGKTTILSLIMRLYDCGAGEMFVDNQDIKNFSRKSFCRNISFVGQNTFLFNESIRYNLVFGASGKVSQDAILESLEKVQMSDFIKKLPQGLDTEIGDRGLNLSGGQRQRLAIARALIRDTDILILDEAMNSVDEPTERLVQQAIAQASVNRTIIIVAHRFSTIKNADRIIVIEKGETIEQGTICELLKSQGLFYRYWNEQQIF
ncbi:MAG: ABC transporter ATP-binding protein [Candidatus Omnitrophica bacterium]|nr:ABC transporter ATP-binding protein [Candidatus Omnitrophota bacterium]